MVSHFFVLLDLLRKSFQHNLTHLPLSITFLVFASLRNSFQHNLTTPICFLTFLLDVLRQSFQLKFHNLVLSFYLLLASSRAFYETTHSGIDPQTSIYLIFIQSDAKFIDIISKFRIIFIDLRNDPYCTA